jgi:hypothetical protein
VRQPAPAWRRQGAVTFETAVAVLAHSRADLDDVARTLCKLAALSFALGEHDRCRDSIDAAEALLRERGRVPGALRPVS